MEGSGGIEPPVSPCAWGCACQSTCCPCCRRGYRAPAAGIGIRRVRRRCASGSCTRQAGSMEKIPDCHLGGAIWSTIYGWWSTVARDVTPGQYSGTGVRLPRATAVGMKGETCPQLPHRVGAMYLLCRMCPYCQAALWRAHPRFLPRGVPAVGRADCSRKSGE